jgi:hypothetical protein
MRPIVLPDEEYDEAYARACDAICRALILTNGCRAQW